MSHKSTPMYMLRDFDLTVAGGRIDLVTHPANGEPPLHAKSASALVDNGDGTFSAVTSTPASDDAREVDGATLTALLTAKNVYACVSKMLTLGTDLSRAMHRHMPMVLGTLAQLDEMYNAMMHGFDQVPDEGTLDVLIRAQLVEIADVFMAISEGREPVKRSAADVEKAGRVMAQARVDRLKGLIEGFIAHAKEVGVGDGDLRAMLDKIFAKQRDADDVLRPENLADMILRVKSAHEELAARVDSMSARLDSDEFRETVSKAVGDRLFAQLPGSGVAPDDASAYVQMQKSMRDGLDDDGEFLTVAVTDRAR